MVIGCEYKPLANAGGDGTADFVDDVGVLVPAVAVFLREIHHVRRRRSWQEQSRAPTAVPSVWQHLPPTELHAHRGGRRRGPGGSPRSWRWCGPTRRGMRRFVGFWHTGLVLHLSASTIDLNHGVDQRRPDGDLLLRRRTGGQARARRGRAARPAAGGPAGDRRGRRHGGAGAALPGHATAAASGRGGWGIPMATDIAFAVGCSRCWATACPASLQVLLLSLAIVDDIGAILVIAIFYTDDRHLVALAPRSRWWRSWPSCAASACGPSPPTWSWARRSGWRSTSRAARHPRRRDPRPDGPHPPDPPAAELDRRSGRDDLSTSKRRGRPPRWPASRSRSWSGSSTCCTPGPLRHRPALRPGQRRHPAQRRRARPTPPARASPTASCSAWWWASSSASPSFTWLAARLRPRRAAGRRRVAPASWASPRSPASASPCRSSSPGWPSTTDARQNDAKIGILAASVVAAALGTLILSRRAVPRSGSHER